MAEDLFGQSGIDTSYEREQINYHPEVKAPKKDQFFRIDPAIIQKIVRSQDFTIASTLSNYDELIARIERMMQVLDERNKTESFFSYKKALTTSKKKDVVEQENSLCGSRGSGDAEIYTILYRMLASCKSRRDFMDDHYRIQITDVSDIDEIRVKEEEMINEWVKAEQSFLDLTDEIQEAYEHSYSDEEGTTDNPNVAYLEKAIYEQEITKKSKEVLQVSLADTSYIHRNRYVMFSDVLNQIQFLITDASIVMKSDLKQMIMQLSHLADKSAAAAQVMIAFNAVKDQLNALKGQYALLDDQKEDFISKQQWFYQQVESKSGTPIRNWLYDLNESGAALDALAEIMVGSLQKSREMYNSSIVDMSRFYQQESIFYGQQFSLIQKKEEIRRFLRILEDLQEVTKITDEWATEYLLANGYAL